MLLNITLFIENNLQNFLLRVFFAKEKYKVTSSDIFLLKHVFCSITLLGFYVKVSTVWEWWLQRLFILQHFVLQTLLHSNLLTTFFIPFIKRNNANKKVRQWHFNIFLHSSQNIECQIILTFLFFAFKMSIFKIMTMSDFVVRSMFFVFF